MIYTFLSGAIASASIAAAGFFYRFYRKTMDRFFLFFALAFTGFSIERFVIVLLETQAEEAPLVYLIRFTGYLMIILAILDKNTRPRKS